MPGEVGHGLSQLWLFIVAPLLVEATAAAVYRTASRPAAPLTAGADRALESEWAERLATRRPTDTPS